MCYSCYCLLLNHKMYRYELHKEMKKQICLSCKKRRFVRYMDLEKSEMKVKVKIVPKGH